MWIVVMSVRIDGKSIASKIRDEIKQALLRKKEEVFLHIVYVGLDPVIDNFIAYKSRFGEYVGVKSVVHQLSDKLSEEEIVSYIQNIQNSDGIIIQLPLPPHYNRSRILDSVSSEQDVDVLGKGALTLFREGKSNFIPPVVGAILSVLSVHNIDLINKNVVIVGNGVLVGSPMSLWLNRENISHTVIDKSTSRESKEATLQNADIIISGVGQPHMITKDMVKDGVVLIDAGTSESGKKILGDIHPDCYEKSSFYTPVPGGIGPITIAILYRNLVQAFLEKKHD